MGTGIVDAAAVVAAAAAGVQEADLAVPLTNRVPLSGQSAGPGEGLYFRLQVPAGVTSLSLRTYGGSGDVSLYVAAGYVPTPSSYAKASIRLGNTEALVLSKPAAGTYLRARASGGRFQRRNGAGCLLTSPLLKSEERRFEADSNAELPSVIWSPGAGCQSCRLPTATATQQFYHDHDHE